MDFRIRLKKRDKRTFGSAKLTDKELKLFENCIGDALPTHRTPDFENETIYNTVKSAIQQTAAQSHQLNCDIQKQRITKATESDRTEEGMQRCP